MNIKNYPPKDEIYDIYVTKNYSCDMASEYFHVSKSTFFKIIKFYNIKKDKKLSLQLRINTVQQKYGVSNISRLPEVKQSKKETALEHYGVAFPTQSEEVKNKTKQTNLLKYGSVAPSGNSEVLNKMQETCLQRYGVINPSSVEEFQNKRKTTNLAKFGVECNLSLKEQQEKIKETCIKKYGVPYYCMSKNCCGVSHGSYSRANDLMAQKLKEKGIAFEREYCLNNYIYDFKIDNILLEINPTYTHSIDIAYHNKKEKMSFDYHYNKTTNALNCGFLCIHIFDWTNIEEIFDNIINNRYSSYTIQKKEIETYFVNIKTKECIIYSDVQDMGVELPPDFVRVCDDGYKIILE